MYWKVTILVLFFLLSYIKITKKETKIVTQLTRANKTNLLFFIRKCKTDIYLVSNRKKMSNYQHNGSCVTLDLWKWFPHKAGNKSHSRKGFTE